MSRTTREVRFILTGLGNIGRTLLEVLSTRRQAMGSRYGLDLCCVGVADSTGAAYEPAGFDLASLAALKRARRGVAALAQHDPALSAVELAARA